MATLRCSVPGRWKSTSVAPRPALSALPYARRTLHALTWTSSSVGAAPVALDRVCVQSALTHPQLLPSDHVEPSEQRGPLQSLVFNVCRAVGLLGLAFVLVLSNPQQALAAKSGGRIGGTAGFSRAAATATRSSAGGTSRGGWARSPAARSTFTHHNRTTFLSAGPSFGLGWGWGHPWGWGGASSSACCGPTVVPARPLFLGSFLAMTQLMILIMGMALAFKAIRMVTGASSRRASSMGVNDSWDAAVQDSAPPLDVTVSKVQVCLLSSAHTLKEELDFLGSTATTGTTQGLHMLLQETILALLRNPAYWVSASTYSQTLTSARAAERVFGTMVVDQRARVQQETLVNVDGRGMGKNPQVTGGDDASELMVVTLLVAAEGRWDLPSITSAGGLRAALTRLGGVTPNNIMAVDVMWTPQADNDSLTHQDVMADYPELVPV